MLPLIVAVFILIVFGALVGSPRWLSIIVQGAGAAATLLVYIIQFQLSKSSTGEAATLIYYSTSIQCSEICVHTEK